MPKFKVLDTIDAGKRYTVGDTIELTTAVAAPLLAAGVIKPAAKAKTSTGSKTPAKK